MFISLHYQSARLGLGEAEHSLTWVANSIVLQTFIESLVLTVVMEEGANIGILEEHLSPIVAILLPFCAAFSHDTN